MFDPLDKILRNVKLSYLVELVFPRNILKLSKALLSGCQGKFCWKKHVAAGKLLDNFGLNDTKCRSTSINSGDTVLIDGWVI